MKCICISCFDYYDTRMGEIIDAFKEHKFEVIYFVADFNHFSKKYVKDNIHTNNLIHVPEYKENLSVRRIVSHLCFSRCLKKILFDEKPDVIYSIIPPNSIIASIAIYKKEYPKTYVILDFFDSWPESFPYDVKNPLKKKVFNWWANVRDGNITCANKIILVSDNMKEILKKMLSNKQIENVVIPPSMNAEFIDDFHTNIEKEIRFCYLGNINHVTDTDTIIKLLSGISQYKKVTLEIIGNGSHLASLQTQLILKKVNVVCHGVVFDNNKKRKIFQRCAFGINIPKAESMVSMSLKSIEYMRAGLPYINTASGENKKIIEKYNAGINLNSDNLNESILLIANLNSVMLAKIQESTKKAYIELFKPGIIRYQIEDAVKIIKSEKTRENNVI